MTGIRPDGLMQVIRVAFGRTARHAGLPLNR